MKKIFLGCVVVLITMAGQLSAQTITNTPPPPTNIAHRPEESVTLRWELLLTPSGLEPQGAQTVSVPGGRGTLTFTNNSDKISNVVFIDAAGKRFNLLPSRPGTGGAPQPSCKYPLPDACFGTADKSIGLCMCKPTDLNNNNGGISIALLLPAVQASRAAANRAQ